MDASPLGRCSVQTSLLFDSIPRLVCDNILVTGLMEEIISDNITNENQTKTKQSENQRR